MQALVLLAYASNEFTVCSVFFLLSINCQVRPPKDFHSEAARIPASNSALMWFAVC